MILFFSFHLVEMSSESTIKSYTAKYNKLKDLGEFDDNYINNEQLSVIKFIKSYYTNINTQNAVVSSLLYFTDKDEVYYNYFKELKKQIDVLKNQQKLPENKIINYKQWPEYVNMFNEALKNNMPIDDLIIMAVYTLIAPVRLDYSNMIIIKDLRMAKGIDTNYCLLRKTKPVFIFRAYKTASSKGEVIINIPKQLALLLEKLRLSGRKVVYDGNDNLLSKRISHLFNGSSLNILRHSYIDFKYKNDLSIIQKEHLAHDMMNSPFVQEQYRTINNDKD